MGNSTEGGKMKMKKKFGVWVGLVVLCAAVIAVFGAAVFAKQEVVACAAEDAGFTHNHTTRYNGSLSTDGDYYLNNDVESRITVAENVTVTLCLNGHTVNGGKTGTVIEIKPGAKLTLCDCQGTGCITGGGEVGFSSLKGGGVRVSEQAEFVMHSGTIGISGTIYNNAHEGGGVYVSDDGTFKMYGGSITNNQACGGGVYVESGGTFEISGGEISGNSAINGTVVSPGGTYYTAGGVYVENGAAFKVSGAPKITDNYDSVYSSNVGLEDGATIEVAGALKDGDATAQIGVNTQSTTGVFTTGYGVHNKDGDDVISPDTYFLADNEATDAVLDGGEGKLVVFKAAVTVGDSTVKYDELDAAWTAATNGGTAAAPAAVKLFTDWETTETLTVAGGIELDLNGYAVAYGGEVDAAVITVSKDAQFILKNTKGNGTVTGGTRGGVRVDGGAFRMSSGTIAENTSYEGAGVYVTDNGSFTMEDGTISGNTSTSYGGGVCSRRHLYDGRRNDREQFRKSRRRSVF